MNPNIQKHIGSILVALAGIGTELLGKTTATSEESSGPTAEPTDQKPKGPGRTKKEPVTASVEPAAPVEEKKPDPAPAVTGALTIDELKALILPQVTAGKGPEVKKITDAHLPADRQGQGIKALVEFPEKHASFKRDIEALAY